MKIAVDARSLLTPHPRGEGRTLRCLYQNIAQLRPDWDVRLYGEWAGECGVAAPNVSTSVVTVPGFRFDLWENLGLPLVAKLGGADLLHGASSSTPRFPLVPAVMTVHDVIPLVFDDGQNQAAVDRFRTQLEFGLRRARAVIAVSENTKADLISLFSLDPARITVIYWGAGNPQDPAPMAAPRCALPQLDIRRPYLLAFAGEARRKNTETVIRAFARLDPRGPDLVLVGLNNPAARKRFAELAGQLGCSGRVLILDYVDDEVLELVLRGATALLYVSLYEGFGLPLLEAMTRGVPIITSSVSSMPEIVGDAALLVGPSSPIEIAEAIQELVSRPEYRNELAERGLKRAKAFRWKDTASRTISVFERVTSR